MLAPSESLPSMAAGTDNPTKRLAKRSGTSSSARKRTNDVSRTAKKTKSVSRKVNNVRNNRPMFDDFSNSGDPKFKLLMREFKASGTESTAHHLAEFLRERQSRLEVHARELLNELIPFNTTKLKNTLTPSMLEHFKQQAEAIRESSLAIKEFSVSHQANSELGVVNDQLSETVWNYIAGGTKIVVLLSDILSVIRTIESEDKSSKDKWVAPSSFERSTHKYWVDENYLSDVMLSCVTEVPMLIYGKSGLLSDSGSHDSSHEIDMTDIWKDVGTQISSIYFDSPDMYLYKRRIARSEGAKLFRVRWYGKKPRGNKALFLELKTHHEQWIADKSVKQRVSLRERDMRLLLARDSTKWTNEFAQMLVLQASPNLEDDVLAEAVELLLKIRKLIIKRDLRPCVRTTYLRAAFQSATSNALRLTIDRDINMIDESGAALGEWSLPEAIVRNAATTRVPCAVFEVKLAGSDNPAFMEKLLGNGAIQDGHKFSKFLSGAATCHTSKIDTLPYWASLPMFEPLFGRQASNSSGVEPKVPLMEGGLLLNDDAEFSEMSEMSSSAGSDARRAAPKERRSSSLTATTASSYSSRRMRRGSRFSLSSFFGKDEDDVGAKKMAPIKRARVEPKTHFANERTFIQWISASLLLVTVAGLLLAVSEENQLGDGPRVLGLILVCIAIFICIWAAVLYYRRLNLLTQGSPYGYIDYTGPLLLTLAVLAGIIAMMVYGFAAPTGSRDTSRVVTVDSSGKCVRHLFSGISLLEYEPSDVLLDGNRDRLIIPSQSKLTGLAINGQEEQALVILTEVPGADFEAVTFVGDTLYAASERGDDTTIMAFEPSADGGYTLSGEWTIKDLSQPEGMVYASNKDGGKLLLSGLTNALETVIKVYAIPGNLETVDGKMSSLYELNARLITSGISDAPKIGSMAYFEDKLFILHDNARVVRGWDLKSGEMVSEWTLPRVDGDNDKQWEGLFLKRDEDTLRQNLFRGESQSRSSVTVYLALDTPPQIWSFRLETKNGILAFPECAAAL